MMQFLTYTSLIYLYSVYISMYLEVVIYHPKAILLYVIHLLNQLQ